jgi:hypothetical protein
MLVLSAITVIPGIAGIGYFGFANALPNRQSAAIMTAVCAAFALLGLGVFASSRKTKLVLSTDRILLVDLFSSREIRRSDVAGFRTIQNPRGTSYIVLLPVLAGVDKLRIPKIYPFDANFYNWLQTLPDLAVSEALELEHAVDNDAALGNSVEERRATAQRARLLGRTLTIVTFAVAAWTWFVGVPYRLLVAILVLLPWAGLALAAKYKGLFRIDSRNNDPHPSIGFALLLPGLVLALRVIYDLDLIGWQRPIAYSLMIDAAICIAAAKLDSSLMKARSSLIALALVSIAYGFGVAAEVNALFDRSQPQVFQALVTGKRISHGRSTSYHLQLSGWGPKPEGIEEMVSRRVNDITREGDLRCVWLRPGALGMSWYVVKPCR